ncbi:MAG: glycosyltransferase, partial [Chloroflexi bacterium]|nr:glycosyltransferase [Chloroflexota bacterium]
TSLPPCEFLEQRAPLGREEARERLGLQPEARVALMFGLVRKYKGLEVMLRALAQAPEVRLLVAGEFYEAPGRFETLAAELGVAGRVTFANRYIPDEEVPLYLAAADVLVAPYTSASQSGVLPQALAAGLPVIASDFEGLTQYFRPGVTGLAVPPGDAGALAAALREFFRPGRAEQFRAAAAAASPSGTWSAFAVDLLRGASPLLAPARSGGWRQGVLRWRTALEVLVLLASGGFIARAVWASAAGLNRGSLSFRGWPLLLALGMEVLAQLMLAMGWMMGLRRSGVRVGLSQAARIRGTTQMVRYIPGNIWHVLSRLSLAERAGLPLGRVGASMVLEEGMILLAGIAVSLITLPFWSGLHPTAGYLLLFALLPLGLAALHPQVLQVGVDLGCRLFKFPSAALTLRYRDILLLFAYYTAGRFVVASATYFSVAALYPIQLAALPAIIGITTLAWAVGYLSFLTPSGLGVREAAMLVLLGTLIPARVAGVAVLLARLFSVAGELIFGGLALALGQRKRSTLKRLSLERSTD